MKKILFLSIFIITILFPISKPALAAPGDFVKDLEAQTRSAAGTNGADLGKPQDPRTVVARIVQIFLSIIGTLLFCYTIYGGALIFLSGGSEDKVNEGKTVIKHAIVGLIVVLSSYSITVFVSRMVVGDSGECGPEDTNCYTIQEDRKKYEQENYTPTPFTPKAEISPELKSLFD